jgi:hypothetical protein
VDAICDLILFAIESDGVPWLRVAPLEISSEITPDKYLYEN